MSFEQLEDALTLDEHDLDSALLEQGDLYYRAAKCCVLESSRRDAAKQALDEAEAHADSEVRRQVAHSETRVTEPEIAARKTRHPEVVEARNAFVDIKTSAAIWAALERAYEQRMKALDKLTDLYRAGYFSDRAGSRMDEAGRDVAAVRGREALQREREGRGRSLATRRPT